jgi:ribose 1,5-bisphosphokinase
MGTLFYVVGASGAGKDSLMGYARKKIAGTAPVFFAHRYITRPAEAGGENHVALTRGEFAQMRMLNLFALSWESHGHGYGLGLEINCWLQRGANVVMNGSRGFLPDATQLYPENLCVVLIEVNPHVLRARLQTRGREPADEIEVRVARATAFEVTHPALIRIQNDGRLEDTGEELVSVLSNQSRADPRTHRLSALSE